MCNRGMLDICSVLTSNHRLKIRNTNVMTTQKIKTLTVLIPTKNETGSIRADAAGGEGGLLDQTPRNAITAVKTAGAAITIN